MTSPLRAVTTFFESGKTCIAEALVDSAAAKNEPCEDEYDYGFCHEASP
jgi:hypothetical protein